MRNKIRHYFCPPFRPMIELLPEMREGNYGIIHHTLDEDFVKLEQLRSMMNYRAMETRHLEATTYVQLRRFWTNDRTNIEHSSGMMSDTPMERQTNIDFIRASKGNVLIAGLGIGMVLWPLIHKEEVSSITVIELQPEIIKMIEPVFAPLAKEQGVELKVICDSIFDWKIPKEATWNTIYFDIWNDICGDNYDEMKVLHRRFSRRRPVGGWIGSWRKADVREVQTGRWSDDYHEGFKR